MKPEAQRTLDMLHDNLLRAKLDGGFEVTPGMIVDFPPFLDSDGRASAEQLMDLGQKVDRLREHLFATASPFTVSPDYKEWVEEEWITEPEAMRRFYKSDEGKFQEVMADLDPNNETSLKLFMNIQDRNIFAEFSFYFDGKFNIIIQFVKDQNPADVETYYESGEDVPLQIMNREEWEIINGFIDEYMELEKI